MKYLKKIASVLVAAVMVMAMCLPAFAESATTSTTGTLTVNSEDTHEYSVYQIFTGDYSEGVLSNVKWGKNGTGTQGEKVADTVLDALTGVDKDLADAGKLTTIEQYANLTGDAFATVSKDKPAENIPAGYYLVKDKDAITGDDAATTYITLVVGTNEIKRKAAKPTDTKEVQDEIADAQEGADTEGYSQTADHAINESFKFRLTATIPADKDLAAYSTYPITFHDVMSKGITFEKIDSVTVDGTEVEDYSTTATEGMEGDGSTEWTITTPDLKYVAGFSTKEIKVVVVYSAHLNKACYVTPKDGTTTTNENKSHITYNNNPSAEGTGKTEDKHTFVFTYEVDNTKYHDAEKAGNELKDAGFTLYESDGETVIGLIKDGDSYRPVKAGETAVEMKSAEDGKFNIKGLDAGTYVLKETTTPAGYNTCDPINIVISASHDVQNTKPHVDLGGSQNMSNKIIDNSGSTLPSTGGMGTTLFYVIGGVLVLLAAVLIISKKRVRQ